MTRRDVAGTAVPTTRQATAMDDDDDIIVPNDNRVSLKCPLTSSTFVDPVKNKVSSYA